MFHRQFRSLLRQSSQFSAFNFREYARRRTKDAFRAHEKEAEDRKIQELIQEGLRNLRMMKVSRRGCGCRGLEGVCSRARGPSGSSRCWSTRSPRGDSQDGWDGLCSSLTLLQRQTVISQFYQMDKLVVEGQATVCSLTVARSLQSTTNTHTQGKQGGDEGGIVRPKDTG